MCACLTLGLALAMTLSGVQPPAHLPESELLLQAEEAFQQGAAAREDPDKARGRFARAADLYEQLRQRGASNVALYRNQGNSNLLAGRLPQAVLAYRRGLRLAAHDRELRDNLEYARDQVSYPGPERRGRPPRDDWPAWLPRIPEGLILALALGLYALACVCVTHWLLTGRRQPLTRATILLGLAIGAGGLWMHLKWQAWRESQAPLVVIAADGVELRRGNGPNYPSHAQLPQLNRGMEANLLHRRGDWLQVRLPGGSVGWVPVTAALVDD
ncbi:MAG: SH3 domain-containing protein [Gemmataceae bacterium]|nr:SH3 domain-containing protein [Gemmataceae bacterium]